MPYVPTIVCNRCKVPMKPSRNGVLLEYTGSSLRYKVNADEWVCPKCGVRTWTGFAAAPLATAGDAGYERLKADGTFGGILEGGAMVPVVVCAECGRIMRLRERDDFRVTVEAFSKRGSYYKARADIRTCPKCGSKVLTDILAFAEHYQGGYDAIEAFESFTLE